MISHRWDVDTSHCRLMIVSTTFANDVMLKQSIIAKRIIIRMDSTINYGAKAAF
jgi:hypothetical protein